MRPSVLLVVIDTLRADAVSAYGSVRGTTPHIDALAHEGLLYENAFAPSPWTLPSHATLFTGLPVMKHAVGSRVRILGEQWQTLAERMLESGYATAGFSMNPLISRAFQMDQGFEHFDARNLERYMAESFQWSDVFDVVGAISTWLAQRRDERPLFLFVNLFDPHEPYKVRDLNPFVPQGVPEDALRARPAKPSRLLCDAIPTSDELEILRGLYLGDVRAADAKLGEILAALRRHVAGRLVSVVTSDHDEHLGERRLMSHEFSVAGVVLRVPMVVHGLPRAAPARIEAPVDLADLVPSILQWTGAEVPAELPGRPLPTKTGAAPQRSLVAFYSDRHLPRAPEWVGVMREDDKGARRRFCGPSDPVRGSMVSLLRYPLKAVWYERYPPELYDLSWDPNERSNLAAMQPDVAARLVREAEAFAEGAGLVGEATTGAESLSEEALDSLRELGYVE